MNNDMDAQFLCKDCARFNQCQYYDRRKEDSYICKYFHLTETYGMTNWEVLKSIFSYAEIVGGDETLTAVRIDSEPGVGTPIVMYTEWLNAPYQKGGE